MLQMHWNRMPAI